LAVTCFCRAGWTTAYRKTERPRGKECEAERRRFTTHPRSAMAAGCFVATKVQLATHFLSGLSAQKYNLLGLDSGILKMRYYDIMIICNFNLFTPKNPHPAPRLKSHFAKQKGAAQTLGPPPRGKRINEPWDFILLGLQSSMSHPRSAACRWEPGCSE